MRPPDSIDVLLRVRRQKEQVEERKLAAILKQLKFVQGELENLSAELAQITQKRLSEIQCILPSTHYQADEAYSRSLWNRSADHLAQIERLRTAQAKQMSAYLSAHREREVMENLSKRRNDRFDAERQLREQKLNQDLFLSRRVAKWDT